MRGPQLPKLEDQHQLAPVIEEMASPLPADALDNQWPHLALQSCELSTCEVTVPIAPIVRLDPGEPRSSQNCSGLLHVGHVVSNALESEELEHVGGIRTTAAAQPVTHDQLPASTKHTIGIGEERCLVRNLHDGILGEIHVEATVRKRQGAGGHAKRSDSPR